MEKLLSSLSQFNRREQTILLVGALLIAFGIIWFALISPLSGKRDKLIKSTAALEQTLGRVQLLKAQLQMLGQQSNQSSGGDNIMSLVNSSLGENGMALTSINPGAGGEVRVRIDKASSESLMQWLYDLETKHHISVRELSINATNELGQVSTNVRLVKP